MSMKNVDKRSYNNSNAVRYADSAGHKQRSSARGFIFFFFFSCLRVDSKAPTRKTSQRESKVRTTVLVRNSNYDKVSAASLRDFRVALDIIAIDRLFPLQSKLYQCFIASFKDEPF